MKVNKPTNPNYCATVVAIKNKLDLAGCDNVVGTTIFGYQAIISKQIEVGTLGIVFPTETQLSDTYCTENNMYRHAESNRDKTAKGYIEDSRRVRAIKFRGHVSNALFMPLSSLSYLGIKEKEFKEGMEFDTLEGQEVCKKYEVFRREKGNPNMPKQEKFSRVDVKFIPEHYDTENYFKNSDKIAPNEEVTITQKLHGTSVRIGNILVRRKLSLLEHITKILGAKVLEHEYDYVFGSKRVIKDANNPLQNHYYDSDLWTHEGQKLKGLIPEGFVLYGELIGFTPEGKPIQKGYTYHLPPKECALYIYRVAFVNEKGLIVDLSWNLVKEFCTNRGLNHVPEITKLEHQEFLPDVYLERNLKKTSLNRSSDFFGTCLSLSDPDSVDEGVCIRVDRAVPYILKAKSRKFLEYETKLLDEGAEDLESSNT